MNGQQIINHSEIGKLDDGLKFLDGRTMAEFKTALINLADKAIEMIPGAVEKVGAAEAKVQLASLFSRAAKASWKGTLDYFSINASGNKAITQIENWQLDDIARIVCNHIK